MVGGAVNAIKDAGKDPVNDIVTVGFNADPEAITLIQNGELLATVAQDPYGMGVLTVVADQYLAGQTPEFGNAEEREVYMPVTLVTAENVADFAKCRRRRRRPGRRPGKVGNGAGDGIRTRDIQLGRLALHH